MTNTSSEVCKKLEHGQTLIGNGGGFVRSGAQEAAMPTLDLTRRATKIAPMAHLYRLFG